MTKVKKYILCNGKHYGIGSNVIITNKSGEVQQGVITDIKSGDYEYSIAYLDYYNEVWIEHIKDIKYLKEVKQ